MKKSIQLVAGVKPHEVHTAEVQPKPCSPTQFKMNIEDRTLRVVWETKDVCCFKCAEGDEWLIRRELTSSPTQYATIGQEMLLSRSV